MKWCPVFLPACDVDYQTFPFFANVDHPILQQFCAEEVLVSLTLYREGEETCGLHFKAVSLKGI